MSSPSTTLAAWSADGMTWAYLSEVVRVELCPTRPATVRMSAPAASNSVTTAWRTSLKRTPAQTSHVREIIRQRDALRQLVAPPLK